MFSLKNVGCVELEEDGVEMVGGVFGIDGGGILYTVRKTNVT